MLRSLLISASESDRLHRLASTNPLVRTIVDKFVAGETLDEGLATAKELAGRGFGVTLDYLGESVTDADDARAAAAVYADALTRIQDLDIDCGVSVKPSQMGMGFDDDLCTELLGSIADTCQDTGVHLTLDMEGSDVTDATIALVEQLHAENHTAVGCAVQSYLHRTVDDIGRLNEVGASLRLCKGAYAEPDEIAYDDAEAIRESFIIGAQKMFTDGVYPRLATHDHVIIERLNEWIRQEGISTDAFEYQMLYGVRDSLQQQLIDDGYRLRVYVPFGDQWYPYFMRRLAERPANLMFFLRSLRDT